MAQLLITAGVSLLAGWWIRRKSAELLKVRRANRLAQAMRRAEQREKIARRPASWEQIKKLGNAAEQSSADATVFVLDKYNKV